MKPMEWTRPVAKRFFYQMKRLSKTFESCYIGESGFVYPDKIFTSSIKYGRHAGQLLDMALSPFIQKEEVLYLFPKEVVDSIKKDSNLRHMTMLYREGSELLFGMEVEEEDSQVEKTFRIGTLIPKRQLPYLLQSYKEVFAEERKEDFTTLTKEQIEKGMDYKTEVICDGMILDYSKYLTPGVNLKESSIHVYHLPVTETLKEILHAPIHPDYVRPYVFAHVRHDVITYHLYVYIQTPA